VTTDNGSTSNIHTKRERVGAQTNPNPNPQLIDVAELMVARRGLEGIDVCSSV
jgi:hypothetical protein